VPILDRVLRTGEPVVLREVPLHFAKDTEARAIDVLYHPHRNCLRNPSILQNLLSPLLPDSAIRCSRASGTSDACIARSPEIQHPDAGK
jgi:hypothetical protein